MSSPQITPNPTQLVPFFLRALGGQNMPQGDAQSPLAPSPGVLPPPQAQQATAQPQGATAMPESAPSQPQVAPAPPPQTKAHKLMQILMGGLQGAIAGQAASAESYARTGRNGGFGVGLEAGYQAPYQLPFLRKYQQAQLEAQQAETEQKKAITQRMQNSTAVTLPNGGQMMVPNDQLPKILQAQIGAGARTQAAEIGAGGRIGAAQVQAGKPVVVPGRGLFQKDENGQYQPVQGAEVPQVLMTAEEAQAIGHPELANQEIDMGRYSQLLRGTAAQTVPVQGTAGPTLVNKISGKKTPLGLGAPAMGGVVQVADPNNPGNVTYATKSQAVSSGAQSPQSATTQAAKATLKSATSGKMGDEINAYKTALAHADLLDKVSAALQNNDTRALNTLKNQWKSQFGSSNLNDFSVVANAYSREVTKMLSGGHLTDSEISQQGATLPNNANLATLRSAIANYKQLANSKMQVTQQRIQQGLKGQPNLPQAGANDPLAIR